jgi:predicted transcriptional regulator
MNAPSRLRPAILALLQRIRPRELATSQVAEALEIRISSASKVLGQLHEAGLVHRRRVTDNRDQHTTWTMWRATK